MLFDFANIDAAHQYKLLISTVVLRPIAWVVSQDSKGQINAAPFSFFNAFSDDPPIVGIGIGSRKSGEPKDTRANIRETRGFVVDLVSEHLAEKMNITAIEFAADINELTEAGLTTQQSVHERPRRIRESPVAMECELFKIIELGEENGLVLGRVVAMHIHDEAVLDAKKSHIDTPKLKLVGRKHGSGWYARTSDLFQMPRLKVEEWQKKCT